MKSEIENQYDAVKVRFHSCVVNHRKELHHIFGRIGVRKCCSLLITGLTHEQHSDWRVLKALRTECHYTKIAVLKNYVRGEGCFSPESDGVPLSAVCLECRLFKGVRK